MLRTMSDAVEFALLAPVPYMHLDSGIEVARVTGYVCFGSQNWTLFKQQIDPRRESEDVPVLFYPSREDAPAELSFKICYLGWYIGHVISDADKQQDVDDGHRPPTVDENQPDSDNPHRTDSDSQRYWTLFWRVRDLERLPDLEHVSIGSLSSYTTGRKRLNKAPLGPTIVARPSWIK